MKPPFTVRRASQGLVITAAALLAAPQAQALTFAFDFAPGLDSYFNANTAALQADAVQAGTNFSSLYSNDVTLHITIQADTSQGALGSNVANIGAITDYATVRNALTSNASTAASTAATSYLPDNSPASALAGGFRMTTAENKALGLSGANDPASDGTIYIATGANWDFNGTTTPAAGAYSLVSALEHEISELMGRTTNINQPSWRWNSPMDLLRYTAPGILDMRAGATGVYFSTDGGKTLGRAYQGPNNNFADIQDWASGAGADTFDAYATTAQHHPMSLVDQEVMNTLGWRSLRLNQAVPEPATWVMMLTGFGMVGSAVRRHRRGLDSTAR